MLTPWKTRFTRASYVTWAMLDGDGVVVNLQNGHYYTLNRAGAVVWGLLMDGGTPEEVAAALGVRYDIGTAQLHADLATFLTELQQEQLIVQRT